MHLFYNVLHWPRVALAKCNCYLLYRFFRSVAYRQFYRFIWQYEGNCKRLPLPCCVYNSIRTEFPSEDGNYKGFIEEEESNAVEESESDSDPEPAEVLQQIEDE